MLQSARLAIANPRTLVTIPQQFSSKLYFSSKSNAQVLHCVDEDCDEFLPWLRRKAGAHISSVLSIGKSESGRLLYASKVIRSGDCILMVPYSAQIWPGNPFPKVKSLLGDEVGSVAKLAITILMECQKGQCSEWAPYISCLPQPGEMNNTIFWNEDELEMVSQSLVYKETINLKSQIKRQHNATLALDRFPEYLRNITYEDFMHAYAVVGSRAWRSAESVSLIPFADFLNHDGDSESIVLSDEDKQLSEVIADRDYAPGEQVLIRYGKFSNATLLLDFGFTLPYNMHDEVQIQVILPQCDPLREMKLDLLQSHCTLGVADVNNLNSWNSFTIKEVRSARGNGRGLPLSLRAFARILCCSSFQELDYLAMEAVKGDGRLARCPLKSIRKEIQAHKYLSSLIGGLIEEYNASIKLLGHVDFQSRGESFALRKEMAHDLLTGELRVLRSASAWLKSYCETLTSSNFHH